MTAAYDMFADEYESDIVDASRVQWPSSSWRGRHLEFARDVLGKRSLAKHQRDILDAYYSASRVDIVVCTGQKLGKTEVEIIIACVDFATEKGLEGLVIGPVLNHSGAVFWKRFCIDILAAYYPCIDCMHSHRAWCALVEVDPFDETPRPERCPNCSPLIPSRLRNKRNPSEGRISDWLSVESCESGLAAPDGRSIKAHATNKEGAKGGFSGTVRVYADECSDVSDETRRACKGNMSGGGKAIWFGNLLHPHGWFARAFKTEQSLFTAVFQISSRFSPNIPGKTVWSDKRRNRDGVEENVVTINDSGDRPIKGMADVVGIESNLREWKNTPNYIAARIDAEHVKHVEGQLAPMAVVLEAERRWNEGLAGEGILQLGVDVARMRDRFAIASKRGRRILEIFAEVLGDEDYARAAILVRDMAIKHKRPHERKPRVVFDKSGPEGQRFAKEIELYADQLEIFGIVMGAPPRNKRLYDKIRDEIATHFSTWLRTGAIPLDGELEAEIEVTTAKTISFNWNGTKWDVSQVILNDDVRKLLGRSPDKRNACELAVWDVDGTESQDEAAAEDAPTSPEASLARHHEPANDTGDGFDGFSMHDRLDAFTRYAWGQS